MSSTYTESSTSTFTEARARAVMKKVLADLVGLANAGHLAATTPAKWHEDLTFAMERDTVRCFQIQLTTPNGTKFALEYEVSWDGTLFEDSSSGGIDWLDRRGRRSVLGLSVRHGRELRQLGAPCRLRRVDHERNRRPMETRRASL